MGLEGSPGIQIAKIDGKLGSVSQSVPEGFQKEGLFPGNPHTDPRFRPSLSDQQGLDYLANAQDRSGANLWVKLKNGVGKYTATDHTDAFASGLPVDDGYHSGGQLPAEYSAKFIASFRKLSPDTLRETLGGYLTPSQIQGTILRYHIMRQDLISKYGSRVLDPGAPIPANALGSASAGSPALGAEAGLERAAWSTGPVVSAGEPPAALVPATGPTVGREGPTVPVPAFQAPLRTPRIGEADATIPRGIQSFRPGVARPAAPAVETPYPLVQKMLPGHDGEIIPGKYWDGRKVQYLNNAADRAPYAVTIRDGKLYDANGNLLQTKNSKFEGGRNIFAMDSKGNVYTSGIEELPEQDGIVPLIKHSSFTAGGPVPAAGDVSVSVGPDGQQSIDLITPKSGHYFNEVPPQVVDEHMAQFVEMLRSKNVDLSGTYYQGWDEDPVLVDERFPPRPSAN